MEKKSCSEKVCKRCGWCCTNLGREIDLTPGEEETLKKRIFERSGVIYLRSIRKFFLPVSSEEADKMRKAAVRLGIDIEIKPNKIFFDRKNNKTIVYDYYLNHDRCAFYADNACLIYKDRPAACRKFPVMGISCAGEVAEFARKNSIDFSGISYEEALKKAQNLCKL